MYKLKLAGVLALSLIILTGCSFVSKIKEKIISAKENAGSKESTKDASSEEDMAFYNKYVEVMNKVQETGGNVYKNYMSEVPAPGSVSKNSLIIPVSLQMSVSTLGNTVKEYERSLLDGGELSKLKASDEMQTTLETDLKALLPVMAEYSVVSEKVSDYYFKRNYKNDMSKVIPYDDEFKAAYDKYKTAFDKFSSDMKKFKPKRKIYDPSEESDPDEASAQVMLNAYGDILEASEEFYDNFENLHYKDDITEANASFKNLEKTFKQSKNSVMNAQFGEKVKIFKYHFEDYFSPAAENFINTGINFFYNAKNFKSENEFNKEYTNMTDYYNRMINSYNTNIGTINRVRSW